MCSFFLSDVPIHTSFNNLSPKHTQTYPQPSVGVSSQERGFAREGWRRDVDEKWHRPTECDQASTSAGKTKPASQFYNDDVSLPTWQCVAEVPSFSSFALFFFFFLFPSLPFFFFFFAVFSALCAFFFYRTPFLFSFFFCFCHFSFCSQRSLVLCFIACNSHGTVLTKLSYGVNWEMVITNFRKDYSYIYCVFGL